MPKTKLKGYAVGEQLYIFCAGSRPDPASTRDLIISAHGGFSKSSSTIVLPHWVRGLYLYGPHGAVLMDPGITTLAKKIQNFEVKGPGDVVMNYGLTKYQGRHSASRSETYESLKTAVSERASAVSRFRGNEVKAQKLALLDTRITEHARRIADKKRERMALNAALENPPAMSDPGPEDFRAVTESQLAAVELEVTEMMALMSRASAVRKREMENGGQALMDAAGLLGVRRDVNIATKEKDADMLALYDVLTIRNRRFRSEMTLKDIFKQLHAAGLMYPRIHCSFCRSPVDQLDSHDMDWHTEWNTGIKR